MEVDPLITYAMLNVCPLILQAVNTVGLNAVVTSTAVIVDASSPAAGYVDDVVSNIQNNDIDYTVSVVIIAATVRRNVDII